MRFCDNRRLNILLGGKSMKKLKRILVLAVSLVAVALFSLTASATVYAGEDDGWIENSDGTWSFYVDGEPVKGEDIYYNGNYYRVDSNGIMYENEWVQPYLFDLETNEASRNTWYYYGTGGIAPSGEFGGYYFLGNGVLCTDRFYQEWNNETNRIDTYYIDKNGHKAGEFVDGWNSFGGNWYYYDADAENAWDCVPQWTMREIGGAKYYFDGDGKMVTDEIIDYYYDEGYIDAYAQPDGKLVTSGWVETSDGEWHYIDDGSLCRNKILNLGDRSFAFDWNGCLLCNYDGWFGGDGAYDDYILTNWNGEMLKNYWYYDDGTGQDYYFVETGWRYYDENGFRVTYDNKTIGDTMYCFGGQYAYEDTVYTIDGKLWYFDSDCKGSVVDGWLCIEGQYWYLAQEGKPVDGWYLYGGSYYYFDDGYMLNDEIVEDGDDWYYLGVDGKLVTEPGYYSVRYGYSYDSIGYNKHYVYVGTEGGRLITGWQPINGTYRYYDPYMVYNTYYWIEGTCYFFDANGYYSEPPTDGFINTGYTYNYFRDGKLVIDDWVWSGSCYYYFNEYGYMLADTTAYVYKEDAYFAFDPDGRMLTNTWYYKNGDVCYATEDGTLASGFVTIDGTLYCFDGYGCLSRGTGLEEFDGKIYIVVDGVAIKDVTDAKGWIKVGNAYYYKESDTYLYISGYKVIDGDYYYFRNGIMCTNEVIGFYFYGADGKRAGEGWATDGKEHYYVDEYGYIRQGYIIEVNGRYYGFNNDGCLMIGTYTYKNWYDERFIVTTDISGAIIAYSKYTGVAGNWEYVDYTSDGFSYVYYTPYGNYYTGWLGDYYLRDGQLVTEDIISYNGKFYYVNAKGLCARNTWVKGYYDGIWALAKPDGSLYCDEWAYVGGAWYYFNSIQTTPNCKKSVDGTLRIFGDDGVWLGNIVINEVENGWTTDNYGNWYYYNAGGRVTGLMNFGSTSYAFDNCGTMVVNDFYYDKYFGADGKLVKYTGWQIVNGEWVYFDMTNTAVTGWVNVNGKLYYIDYIYDDDYYYDYGYGYATFKKAKIAMVTGYYVIGDDLYYFNAGGVCQGKVECDYGWYQAGDDWYFFKNGEFVVNDTVFAGAYYAFDNEGKMITNGVDYNYYYGADGKRVTEMGWIETPDGWMFIDYNGYVCTGIHLINGVEYCFNSEGIWVA